MSFTVDTTAFSAMCSELARKLNVPPEDALREELGRVLTQTLKNTDAATKESIERHQRQSSFSLLPATVYVPKRPGRRRLIKGRVLYDLRRKYPAAAWAAITRAREIDLARRIRARGLAKQSWYLLGEKIGVTVEAPDYVRKAVATTGVTYPEDERVDISRGDGQVIYKIENSQPTVNYIGGARALQRAMDGRASFFLVNISNNVFDNLSQIAKKYPGVTINRA